MIDRIEQRFHIFDSRRAERKVNKSHGRKQSTVRRVVDRMGRNDDGSISVALHLEVRVKSQYVDKILSAGDFNGDHFDWVAMRGRHHQLIARHNILRKDRTAILLASHRLKKIVATRCECERIIDSKQHRVSAYLKRISNIHNVIIADGECIIAARGDSNGHARLFVREHIVHIGAHILPVLSTDGTDLLSNGYVSRRYDSSSGAGEEMRGSSDAYEVAVAVAYAKWWRQVISRGIFEYRRHTPCMFLTCGTRRVGGAPLTAVAFV